MYVYIVYESKYCVGFFDPQGEFVTESVHCYKEDAAARVNYLNGGGE